jgi:hypothetical protein
MKTIFFIGIISALAFQQPLRAQTPHHAAKKEQKTLDEKAAHQAKQMSCRYGLSAEQEQQLFMVQKERIAKKLDKPEDSELTNEERIARRAIRKQQHDHYMQAMKGIMTPEQYVTFELDVAERKAKRKAQRASEKVD